RSAASFSARAGSRSERPPPRYRGRENSATRRQPPGDAPRSARRRSSRYRSRSRRCAAGREHADRADLIGAAGIGSSKVARDVERLVEILAIDEIEAEQLLLGLGIGAVDDQGRIVLAQRSRRRRWQ